MYTHAHAHMYTHAHALARTCTHALARTHSHARTDHTHFHACTPMHAHSFANTHTLAKTCTRAQEHTRAHTDTHTRTPPPPPTHTHTHTARTRILTNTTSPYMICFWFDLIVTICLLWDNLLSDGRFSTSLFIVYHRSINKSTVHTCAEQIHWYVFYTICCLIVSLV